MKTWLITFVATGGITVEADTEKEAEDLWLSGALEKQAAAELVANGIDMTSLTACEDD